MIRLYNELPRKNIIAKLRYFIFTVNAYNDGVLADVAQMKSFYEIESVLLAAFSKPDKSLSHNHAVFHFTGDKRIGYQIAKVTWPVTKKYSKSIFEQLKSI